jgi:hypothetical protein
MTWREQFSAENSILDVLKAHSVELIGEGDQKKAKCPFHKDKKPSFSVNLKDGSWNCFSGCGKGGVLELIAKYDSKTPEEILDAWADKKGLHRANQKSKQDSTSIPIPAVDWTTCVESFTQDHIEKLAKWRGYRPEFVAKLVQEKLIGIAEGHMAFPILAAGRVVGTHQRTKSGWIMRGKNNPWIIGSDHFENVYIFESQWDAFAFMDATRWLELPNFRAVSSIVITRGSSNAKLVRNTFPTTGKILAWMQNDPQEDNGNSPAVTWLRDLIKTIGSIPVCWPPKEHKDLNDWLKSGATPNQIIDAMESAPLYRDPSLPSIKPSLDFRKMLKFDAKSDPDCLLGNRYLCKGGSAIWVGSSGLGKSVLNIQSAITFALNEDLFGLEPKHPLRSVIFSSEDDEGDISETFQGVIRAFGITENDPRFEIIMNSVFIYHESELKGLPFIGYAEQVVRENKADLLWINPLLSYYSGNPNDAQQSGEFCGALSGLQFNTGVCTQLIHHTGKPKESDTTKSWSLDDFSYIGLGSSIWTNWARAIIVLQALKNPSDTFVLRFAKRGNRTGIVDDDFIRQREVFLRHADVGLCWVKSDFKPDKKNAGGRPEKARWDLLSDHWSGEPISNDNLLKLVSRVLSVSDRTSYRVLSKWSGTHILKNTSDLWVKNNGY